MTISQQIIEYASSLFDVVGVSPLAKSTNLLILGLESTPQHNLDDFGYKNGHFQMYGFRKYFQPRLRSLLGYLRRQGFTAEPVGRYGYPLAGEVNLKEHALRAGLGKRGKSTIVLHPKYGTRLRLAAIRTNAPLAPTATAAFTEEENPICQGCTICLDVCPTRALAPYSLPEASLCLSNISPVDEDGRSILCDICLHLCPAYTQGQ